MILASFVLLSMALSSWFDSKRDQIKLFFALGLKNRIIERIFNSESILIALIGSAAGAFSGLIVNIIITRALNSVWRGAVQTDTLESFFTPAPVITGFLVTFILAAVFMLIKIKGYLRKLNRKESETLTDRPSRYRSIYFAFSCFITVLIFLLSLLFGKNSMVLSFVAGITLFISFILGIRQYLAFTLNKERSQNGNIAASRLYYSFYPSQAITPVLFIAAGIFSVFITGANRMDFSKEQQNKSGGTGGYQLWSELSVPVKEDMNSLKGKRALGLDDEELSDLDFVQMKRLSGNDASCLNLNHITVPPLLGLDPAKFIADGSFSFSKYLKTGNADNPWELLNKNPEKNTIYGIADQTVIQWGLKLKLGDTLVLRAENGQPLNIILAGGLKSSVFQGHLLISIENFVSFFPSGSGTQVFLAGGDLMKTEKYKDVLNDRFQNQGINVETTTSRLEAFYQVTNTYLSVFGIFGALGMITGVAGLGFVLLRSYNQRKREFALMLATGFSVSGIRKSILHEQFAILSAGVITGVVSAIVATLPSLLDNPDIPFLFLAAMVAAITGTGFMVLLLSLGNITTSSLSQCLRKE
jgi:ABC-type lipoprotein release transport system permease subunit